MAVSLADVSSYFFAPPAARPAKETPLGGAAGRGPRLDREGGGGGANGAPAAAASPGGGAPAALPWEGAGAGARGAEGQRARVPLGELQALLGKAEHARKVAQSVALAAGEACRRRSGAEGDARLMQEQAVALMAEKSQLSRENLDLRLQQEQLQEQFSFLSAQQERLQDRNEVLAAENATLRALVAGVGGGGGGKQLPREGGAYR